MSKEKEHINKFISFAAKELNLSNLPKIHLVGSEEDKYSAFGHSKGNEIWIRITNRHPGDIMRTIAHELTHFAQNQKGTRGEKMREDQANALAGRLMRKFNIQNPEIFKDKPIEEMESAIPANVMGASSSTHGTGGIDTFDPLMKIKKISRLTDIIGKNKKLKEIK